jgi:hypothetical protein
MINIYKNKNECFTDSCAVIWFPEACHTAVELDDKFYSPYCGLGEVEEEDVSSREKAVIRGERSYYYRFKIGVSSEEKKRIAQEWEKLGWNTCSGNTATLLHRSIGMEFPWVKPSLPSQLASLLYERREQEPHMISIDYVGDKRQCPNIEKKIEEKKWKEWDSIMLFYQCFIAIILLELLRQALAANYFN